MEEETQNQFNEKLDMYEKHLACGEPKEARECLHDAIMLCPYPVVVRLLRIEYAEYRVVAPWNFWSWLRTSFGLRRGTGEEVVVRAMR